ncbi:hypothetical protein AERO8C_70370 [Aeromonas veronii]|uniref:Uncharacterized protein n=1 Tax=Aeromonas veronii TaxID=654 RepID=A0A653LD13_AERVE|nr:hypothetical protein AERO8C_70370 [Aeromonas veronii]
MDCCTFVWLSLALRWSSHLAVLGLFRFGSCRTYSLKSFSTLIEIIPTVSRSVFVISIYCF